MALMATLFGIVVSAPLSFLAARNLMHGLVGRSIYTLVRAVMSIIRSIEPIVWAIIFVVWVRLGAFPGVLALFVHSVADLVKLYSERLESIDPGPVEAITATGANRIQVIRYGIVPQIINPYLSFTLYRWDINVRMATIIGVVGGGGIGQNLFDYIRQWEWEQAGLLMLLIIVAVWAIDYLSSRLRAKLE
jgi:phosphonate transport system permease protein